jgi:hypothetical protein
MSGFKESTKAEKDEVAELISAAYRESLSGLFSEEFEDVQDMLFRVAHAKISASKPELFDEAMDDLRDDGQMMITRRLHAGMNAMIKVLTGEK